jgi:catechol 2,3-dioxygenase-like lactoylglutathione lyase family enzyme
MVSKQFLKIRRIQMEIIGIDHVQVAIPANKETELRDFYGGILELKELPKPEHLAERGGAWFLCGTLQLHLGVEKDFRPAKKAHPALLVTGLKNLLTRLSENGYEIKYDEAIEGYDRAFTADPFGNRIELMERHEHKT